jgi:uncharacterized Zn-finger protein
MNNNQIMSSYEQPNTPLMNEKLPGIDKLPKLEENTAEVPSSAYLPPPPPSNYNFNPGMMYHQHMSPPLTPAVSPSSVLLDSMQFKRKFSVDVGPFAFGTNIPHPSSMHDQEAYRRSSCSAVSMDDSLKRDQVYSGTSDYSFLNSQPNMHHTFAPTTTTTTKTHARRGSRAQLSGPNTQHKHACKYPYCSWSFKRYEHLKRHMLVHTGKRPHVCHFPGCGKSFSRSDNFHAHYRTHTRKNNMISKKSTGKTNHAAAAAVAAAAAATAATTATSVATTASTAAIAHQQQVFDDRAPAYFAKQTFDMTPYQDMYGHRHSYASEVIYI